MPVYVNNADGYHFCVTILRATARTLAGGTGLFLVYGFVFALEGITTQLPATAIRELAVASVCTALWLLLFCSGLHDAVVVTGKEWVLWVGSIAALLFMYYFNHYTSLSLLTQAAMPPIALGVGLIPHFVKRMGFLFALASLGAGIVGVLVLYHVVIAFLSSSTHFATRCICALLVGFWSSAITS